MSLLIDMNAGNYIIRLGGQTLNLMPLQTFSSYTLYEADISSFSGQTAQLSITAPATGVPNGLLIDDIKFSNQPIPEPNSFTLLGLGTMLFVRRVFALFVRRGK